MLIESQKKGLAKIDGMLLERLLAALPAMVDDGRRTSFIETVAVQDISSVVANIVTELAKKGNVSILSTRSSKLD
jgi:hypothetical protein